MDLELIVCASGDVRIMKIKQLVFKYSNYYTDLLQNQDCYLEICKK